MSPHRGAARVLRPAIRPMVVPSTSTLYACRNISPSVPRPALTRGPSSSRTFISIIEPLGEAFMAVHASTGLPWYILIPAISVAQSALIDLPIRIKGARIRQRQALMEPLIAAWRIKTRSSGLVDHEARAKLEMKRIRAETKTQQWRIIVPLVGISMPTWILGLAALRQLANHGTPLDPSFVTEGCLWFSNLAAADPLHIMPIIVGVGWGYRSLPKSFEELKLLLQPGDNSMSKAYKRALLCITPFLVTMLMGMPSGPLLYWVTTLGCHRLRSTLLERYIPHKVPPPRMFQQIESQKGGKK